MSADGEGDRQDGWHGDGDATDQEDEDVVETITVSVVVSGVEDGNLEKDEGTDGDETEGTNLGEDLLQMAGGAVILPTNEAARPKKEEQHDTNEILHVRHRSREQ